VIRLAQPDTPAEKDQDSESDSTAPPKTGARRGFDVEAFDSRFESLWFQRKAYQTGGRDDDAARQTDLIREFVADEGVRRLAIPAGVLILEARAWLREGSYDKALSSLALAESLDPGRPQIGFARAQVLWTSGAGVFAAGAEVLRALRGTVAGALSDLNFFHGLALSAVVALLGGIALFALFMALRHQLTLRHDVEEWLIRGDREAWAKAGGWAVLLLPLVVWIGAGWLALYWIVLFFRYMRRSERALAAVLLLAASLSLPAYRLSVGLYGLAADPTVRTTLAAANGGYDPDRIVKLRELVDAHPDDPMYRFLLAGLYKNGRYFEDAFVEYRRVLEVAPSTYQARINLGNIYFVLGQYGEAIANYRQAIASRPDSALAYYDMYLAQSDSFKLKEATESLSKARDLDPGLSNRLLTSGSRDGGGPKVVDAAIDFDAIWRATVEGRHLREWLDAGPARHPWWSMLATIANTTSVLPLLALSACLLTLAAFRERTPAQRCTRCGRPFCSYCTSGRDGHDYCSQCVHLFVLRDGLAPETKSMKLYEVQRHEAQGRWGRRLSGLILPGAAQLLSGRSFLGFGVLMLWLLAWIAAYPEILSPVEDLLGLGVHWAGLRPAILPDVYRLDAVVLLAVPMACVAWIAGNVGFRRVSGA
jgi:tetratricopeptide (TPR) repeat protein